MPQLESLRLHHTAQEWNDDEITDRRLSQRAHRIGVVGLSQLSHLKDIDIAWTLLDPAEIGDIAKLSGLESASINSSRLDDAGFDRLCSLPHLERISVTDNDLDDRSITSSERLPHGVQLYDYDNPISDVAIGLLAARRPESRSSPFRHCKAISMAFGET